MRMAPHSRRAPMSRPGFRRFGWIVAPAISLVVLYLLLQLSSVRGARPAPPFSLRTHTHVYRRRIVYTRYHSDLVGLAYRPSPHPRRIQRPTHDALKGERSFHGSIGHHRGCRRRPEILLGQGGHRCDDTGYRRPSARRAPSLTRFLRRSELSLDHVRESAD